MSAVAANEPGARDAVLPGGNAALEARLAGSDARIARQDESMANALHGEKGIHAQIGTHGERLGLHDGRLTALDESMANALHGEGGMHAQLDKHDERLGRHGEWLESHGKQIGTQAGRLVALDESMAEALHGDDGVHARFRDQGAKLRDVAEAQQDLENTLDGQGDRITALGKSVGETYESVEVLNKRVAAVSRNAVTRATLAENSEAVMKNAIDQSQKYTDQKVGEIRGEIRQMDRSFRKGIASVAVLQMTTPYAPGRVAVNAGTAFYRGQGAVAVGVSYWNTAGDLNINAGVSTAGGNSTVVRAGIGYLF